MVYHVLNRASRRAVLFETLTDYGAFEEVVAQAHARVPARIVDDCIMPNHWHFVLWPRLAETRAAIAAALAGRK